MVDSEDLKIYFYDSFLSSDQFDEETNGTGYITIKPTEILLHGGVTSNSYALLNYSYNNFNPVYAELILKLHFASKTNIIAFVGFKETLDEPTDPMTESHLGIFIKDNKFYFSSANSLSQQKVEIPTIDVTKVYEYKLTNNSLYYKPLPQAESYLGLPTFTTAERVFHHLQNNSTYPPEDKVHYLVFYIKNTSTSARYIKLYKVIYKEEYAD